LLWEMFDGHCLTSRGRGVWAPAFAGATNSC
jgi:hypothetical protein